MTAKAKGSERPIVIPELEQAMKTYKPKNKPWTVREITILSEYYGKVPLDLLMKHLPDRTKAAIKHKAEYMMLHVKESETDG